MSARRGQTMVLGVLFVFLVTLMVLVTLSVGQRTRERIEAQLAADAAAYSSAVVTARTLNELALINRTRTSMLVAMLGVQSLISWSGHHRSHLAATQVALKQAETPYIPCCGNPFCPQSACSCAELGLLRGAQSNVAAEQARIASAWNPLDIAAATYASDLWEGAVALNSSSARALELLNDRLEGQALTNIIVKTANPELDAPAKGDRKSIDETKDSERCENTGGLYCSDNDVNFNRLSMLGTRGWHFVSARLENDDLILEKLQTLVRPFNPGVGFDLPAQEGGSGAGIDRESSQKNNNERGNSFFAEDHGGDLELQWRSATCFSSGGSAEIPIAGVKSNHNDLGGDQHSYTGSSEPAARHNLDLNAGDKSSFPWSYEYNHHELAKPKNDFGQPKLYAIVERDFGQRQNPWPWDLMFRFRFSPSGEGATFDLGRAEGGFKSPAGADLRHQVALSSAIAYYHRPNFTRGVGFWAEPPNLWNPFWRATLYAPDDDLARHVEKAGYPEHADTLRRLLKAGMAGTQ